MASRRGKESAGGNANVLTEQPPEQVFRRRLELRRFLSVILLNLLTVVLLSICFTPFDCWYLAYVALVPWVLALESRLRRGAVVIAAWATGAVFWAVNLYWLWWITLVGYAALVFYLSLYWLAAAVIIRAALRRNWPMWLVLPVAWTAMEYARSYVITGFPWLFLAHSQYQRIQLIQIADVLGQYGVSFFVAMVNGLLADLMSAPLFSRTSRGPAISRRIIAGLAATAGALLLVLTYGAHRLGEAAREEGPVVGIVQQAFPISLHGPTATQEEVFAAHARASSAFLGVSCDLVVWPETMLPTPGLNPQWLSADIDGMEARELRALTTIVGVAYEEARRADEQTLRDFLKQRIEENQRTAEEVARLSRDLRCPILAGGGTLHPNPDPPIDEEDYWVRRNSALLFDRSPQAAELYSKVHLVPFSEYVPFKHSWTWLHRKLRWFVPPVMPQLDPGRTWERFTLSGSSRSWRLAAPICYEGTFDRVCRKMVMDNGRKAADILANLSNDGWFVYPSGGAYRSSTELPQHLAQYCFRAVENRVPVVRAVNTGISASIDSCGRIVATIQGQAQQGMAVGTLLLDGREGSGHGPRVKIDPRVSPYARVGDVFAMSVSLVAAAGVAWLIVRRRREAA